MLDLDPTSRSVLKALIQARPVFVRVDRLASRWPDPRPLSHGLRILADLGWISGWDDAPGGPSILLSSLATEALHLELSDDGKHLFQSRWIGADAYPKALRSVGQGDKREAGVLDLLPDPRSPDPARVTEAAEAVAREYERASKRQGGRRGDLVPDRFAVRHVLGSSWPTWTPQLERPKRGRCAVCGSASMQGHAGLPESSYCLACSRSSWDGRLKPPKVLPRTKPRPDDGLKGGSG